MKLGDTKKSQGNTRPGRPKASSIFVQSLNKIKALRTRLSLPDTVLTFRDITSEIYKRSGVRVSVGTIYRFAGGKEPQDNVIRAALGLPRYVKAKACPHCGEAKLVKRCPCKRNTSTSHKSLFDWPVSVLASAIRNRK